MPFTRFRDGRGWVRHWTPRIAFPVSRLLLSRAQPPIGGGFQWFGWASSPWVQICPGIQPLNYQKENHHWLARLALVWSINRLVFPRKIIELLHHVLLKSPFFPSTVDANPLTEALSHATHGTISEGCSLQTASPLSSLDASEHAQLGNPMASLDGSVESMRLFLVPIASSALQSRFSIVSALVLQIYDWCRSSNPSFRNV